MPELTLSSIQPEPQAASPRISLSANDRPLREVLLELARKLRVNVALDPEVDGAVSVELHDVTFDQALAAILPPLGYAVRRGDEVVRIARETLMDRTFELSFLESNDPFQPDREEFDQRARDLLWTDVQGALETIVFGNIEPATASGAPARAGGVSRTRSGPHGRRLLIQPRSGLISVRDLPANIEAVEVLLDRFRAVIRRRVAIVGAVVEIVPRQAAGDAPLRVSSDSYGYIVRQQGIPEILTELESQGQVNVIARPRLLVSNNQRAMLRLQRSAAPDADKPDVGLELVVIPRVSADGALSMFLHPVLHSASSQGETTEVGELDTVVDLRPGETLIISGLLRSVRAASIPATPTARSSFGTLYASGESRRTIEVLLLLQPTIFGAVEGQRAKAPSAGL